MKQRIWITIATYIAYCIDKELYKAIEYLKVQVEVLIEQQEKKNKRILLTTGQRMRITGLRFIGLQGTPDPIHMSIQFATVRFGTPVSRRLTMS